MALCGCTTENAPAPQQQIPAITLSVADKEKLMAFQKEIMSVETLTDKAVKLAVDELKNGIKGGEVSINVSSVIDKAKALLEYRKKNAQALDLYNVAAAKFKTIMTAAGVAQ